MHFHSVDELNISVVVVSLIPNTKCLRSQVSKIERLTTKTFRSVGEQKESPLKHQNSNHNILRSVGDIKDKPSATSVS